VTVGSGVWPDLLTPPRKAVGARGLAKTCGGVPLLRLPPVGNSAPP